MTRIHLLSFETHRMGRIELTEVLRELQDALLAAMLRENEAREALERTARTDVVCDSCGGWTDEPAYQAFLVLQTLNGGHE